MKKISIKFGPLEVLAAGFAAIAAIFACKLDINKLINRK